MDPGVAGIIGGAVGSVLTGLVRALGIPSEARAHNAAIRDRDDQLATWVADRDYALRGECTGIRARTPLDFPAQRRKADEYIARARSRALHEYRDQERQARLDVARILASEGWAHRLWRRLRGHAAPVLTTPDNAAPVLDSWRRPTSMDPEKHTFPDDATKRTLDDAIASVSATGP